MRIIVFFGLIALFISSCTSEEEKKNENAINQANNIFSAAVSKYKIKIEDSEYVKINLDSIKEAYNNCISKNADSALIMANDFAQIVDSSISFIETKKEEEKQKALKEVDKLKAKFFYEEDEFNNIGFYTHKTWGKYWPIRKTLTIGVNSKGYYYLKSNYYSSDWLFHEKIKVKIGENQYESHKVPRHDKNNKTDVAGGNIYEVITYNEEKEIIKAIAENVNEKITVRFIGTEFYDDVVLSAKDKNAIKDAYNLARYIVLTK